MPLLDPKHRLEFPGLKGVYGAVTVEGEALEVYRVKTVGNRTVGYVEAKDGKEFQVVLRDERTAVKDSYRLGIFVDGMEVDGRLTSIAPYTFAPLQTTDDDDVACTTEAVVKGMGSLATGQEYPQSKKAALSHQTQYGQARTIAPASQPTDTAIDAEPLATVEFRYRSRALLQLEGLIPDDPVASPAASPSASPRPSPGPVASPYRSPSPALAGPSQPRPLPRTKSASPLPLLPVNSTLNMDDDELEAELLALKTQQRIAELEKEKRRRSQGGSSQASRS